MGLPVSDVVNKMLLEHEAPLLYCVQQRGLEGSHVHLHPAVKHLGGLQVDHLVIELFIRVYLDFKVMEEGWALWDTIFCMGFYLLRCEDVPIEQKLTENLLPVLHVEVGILTEGIPVAAAECHHFLHPLHEYAPQAG